MVIYKFNLLLQVVSGAKREDADRKITARLDRDAALLPRGARTAFVLITTDTGKHAQALACKKGTEPVECRAKRLPFIVPPCDYPCTRF